MAVRVFNQDMFTPLYYGDGLVIPALEWVEGEQADFQDLIDKNLVIFVEKPVVSAPIKDSTTATIASSSDSALAKG